MSIPASVKKRTGEYVSFDADKIKNAAYKALVEVDTQTAEEMADKTKTKTLNKLKKAGEESPSVDQIHRFVEESLMDLKQYDAARGYFTYRKERMPDIFRKRIAYKPFSYPDLAKYVDAIQQSYWIVSEYSFGGDIQDFRVTLAPEEKEAVRRSMLAISQVEVAVKEFWGKIGDRLPIPEIQEVGATFAESECYDDQTQVLTNAGWKYFKDLLKFEKVAQYNQTSGEITFAQPSSYLEKSYQGVLHHYEGVGTDICVTPNHEILVMHPQHNHYEKRTSASGKWSRNYRYPSAGISTGSLEFSDRDKLLVAIQADGSLFGETPSGKGRRDFNFTLSKQRKIDRLKLILGNLDIEFYERIKANSGQTIISARLPEDIESSAGIKAFEFVDIEEVGKEYCQSFIEELSFWDSHIRGGNVLYYNTNESAVDKVQIIATLGGMTANKSINRTEEQSLVNKNPDGNLRQSAKDCYVVSITDTDKKVYPKRKEIEYDGQVYCVTVPEGNLVTRRNKRVAIQGNCRHSRAYSHLLEILGLNDEFEGVLKVPAIKKRVDYAQKALAKAKTDSNKDFVESVLLFSLFIENVSLFSQFLIISQMNKEKGVLKGISNVISSTSLEEATHHDFGCALVNTIRQENPEWFDDELEERLYRLVMQAFEAEEAIVDWIFEEGELPYLTRDEVVEYIKNRFNMGLKQAGFKPAFEIDSSLIERTTWFDLQNTTTTHVDFFAKRPQNYTKFSKAFDGDDLFD